MGRTFFQVAAWLVHYPSNCCLWDLWETGLGPATNLDPWVSMSIHEPCCFFTEVSLAISRRTFVRSVQTSSSSGSAHSSWCLTPGGRSETGPGPGTYGRNTNMVRQHQGVNSIYSTGLQRLAACVNVCFQHLVCILLLKHLETSSRPSKYFDFTTPLL